MTKNTKQLVIDLLSQYPTFRDSDDQLMAWIWKLEMEEMGYPTTNTPTQNFLKMFAFNKFTNSETIRRMRQKVQEENKELRGQKYNKRQANQDKVKKELGYK